MTPDEKAALGKYADRFELSTQKLCMLLVIRELTWRRLESLAPRFSKRLTRNDGVRVTARCARRSWKERFAEHANSVGLGSDEAAAIVFRAELEELWLAFEMTGNRS